MKKFVVRYGVIAGILSIGFGLLNWFVIAWPFGVTVSRIVGYLTIILSLMCIALGIKYFRDKLNKGMVSFAQGFKIGLGISFITAFMVACYSILFFVFEADDYNKWQIHGLNESELQAFQTKMEQMPEFTQSLWFQGFALFFTVLLFGLLISLISSLILKRSTIGLNQKSKSV